ncbi:MAG: molybdopterin-guanine dinucleotide biosynthesis protein B [Thermoprotei archaeon]|nr:MAG: molybdopterin-guanine dinucleotide biosynthesis protein B [Thermoprotei archaeon]RLF18447.1 MAG: molybdopterin-guanine dinucleotide biosynthesis protein B [Thermoprotei archaeon]
MKPIIVAVVGGKDTYKTRAVELLTSYFTSRGLRVAALKHLHHVETIDKEGKDTWRFAKAGAKVVVAASHSEVAVLKKDVAWSLKGLIKLVEEEVDVVIIEGFKSFVSDEESFMKIVTAKTVNELEDLLGQLKPPIAAITGPVAKQLKGYWNGIPVIDLDNNGVRLAELIQRIAEDNRCKCCREEGEL